MNFDDLISNVGRAVEAAGVLVIVLGALVATVRFLSRLREQGRVPDSYDLYRRDLGRGLLLGLEFLVAGDIIRTVATSPTLYNVGVLGGIVLIRSFLSFTLELETEGRLPWRPRRRPVIEDAGASRPPPAERPGAGPTIDR